MSAVTSTIIVGNGTSVLDAERGALIDTHAVVVRFNDCRIKGFEKHVGTKTHRWFTVMKHAPGLLSRLQPLERIDVHSWEPRADKCQTCQSYADRGLNVWKVDHAVIAEINAWLGREDYKTWSTGALGVWLMLRECPRVTVTGFDWWEREAHHYADKAVRGSLHRPEVEKQFFDKLAGEGRVQRL